MIIGGGADGRTHGRTHRNVDSWRSVDPKDKYSYILLMYQKTMFKRAFEYNCAHFYSTQFLD